MKVLYLRQDAYPFVRKASMESCCDCGATLYRDAIVDAEDGEVRLVVYVASMSPSGDIRDFSQYELKCCLNCGAKVQMIEVRT
jgi:hypothetical protein